VALLGRFNALKLAAASNYSQIRLLIMSKERSERRLDRLQFRAWRAFLYAYSRVVPTLDKELVRAQGLSLNQFEVLSWLRRAGERGLRMSDLASRVVLSPSGVTRAIDQLERKGLVERCVFERDKRGYLVTLTAEGRDLLRKATAVHVQGLRDHFLKHVSRTELEHLAIALEAVLDGEGSPLPPLAATAPKGSAPRA
jgi:DNA-binding MarR family transcriptional regulator